MREVTCFTLKQREPGETNLSTRFGEILPENSVEARGVRSLAQMSPGAQGGDVSWAGVHEQIVSKYCISPN